MLAAIAALSPAAQVTILIFIGLGALILLLFAIYIIVSFFFG